LVNHDSLLLIVLYSRTVSQIAMLYYTVESSICNKIHTLSTVLSKLFLLRLLNKPHPMIQLRINDKQVWNIILVLTQEIKCDVIFRRMQLKELQRQGFHRIRSKHIYYRSLVTLGIPSNCTECCGNLISMSPSRDSHFQCPLFKNACKTPAPPP
jgi:hypothetical protein